MNQSRQYITVEEQNFTIKNQGYYINPGFRKLWNQITI